MTTLSMSRHRHRTRPSVDNEEIPRLPHEHDESHDTASKDIPDSMRQAHADVMDGKVDTDRGVPMNDAYQRQKQPASRNPKTRGRA